MNRPPGRCLVALVRRRPECLPSQFLQLNHLYFNKLRHTLETGRLPNPAPSDIHVGCVQCTPTSPTWSNTAFDPRCRPLTETL